MHPEALKHLRAGTVTHAEYRYLKFACRTRYYVLLSTVAVSG